MQELFQIYGSVYLLQQVTDDLPALTLNGNRRQSNGEILLKESLLGFLFHCKSVKVNTCAIKGLSIYYGCYCKTRILSSGSALDGRVHSTLISQTCYMETRLGVSLKVGEIQCTTLFMIIPVCTAQPPRYLSKIRLTHNRFLFSPPRVQCSYQKYKAIKFHYIIPKDEVTKFHSIFSDSSAI